MIDENHADSIFHSQHSVRPVRVKIRGIVTLGTPNPTITAVVTFPGMVTTVVNVSNSITIHGTGTLFRLVAEIVPTISDNSNTPSVKSPYKYERIFSRKSVKSMDVMIMPWYQN